MNGFYRKLWFNLGVACLVLIAGFSGWWFFKANIIKSVAKIIEMNRELASRSFTIESFASLRTQLIAARDYKIILNNIVPKEDDLLNLSKDLQAVASKNGLEYGFSFVGETKPSGSELGSINFSLNLSGTLEQFLQFIYDLRSFKYINVIDGLSFNGAQGKGTMGLRGRIFFR